MVAAPKLDEAAIKELLTGPAGPVASYMSSLARQVTNAAKEECPVDTGNLRARHEFTLAVTDGKIVAQVGSTADYGIYVHEGKSTTVKAAGKTVTVKMHPNPWLERALARFGLTMNRGA